jgi:hypothetical protein
MTDKTVSASLNAVDQMVFPFRALETQKQWMQRLMQNPKDLSIWKTAATVGRAATVGWLLITVYHSFLTVGNWTNSLPEKPSRCWNGPFQKFGEPNST